MTQTLVDRVKDYLEGSDFEDDFTILAVERTGQAGVTGPGAIFWVWRGQYYRLRRRAP